MKYLLFFFLALVTGGWIFFTSMNYNGLNSLQRLANYHDGLLHLKVVPEASKSFVKTVKYQSQIHVDSMGIPHIYAEDLNSLAYSIGYMQAKDRYFQMELTAHTVIGELSGIIGEPGLTSDRKWKKFDLEVKAIAFLDSMAKNRPDLYNYLKAYSEGVNAYINSEPAVNRDPMYTIWHYSPGPWKPYYTFLILWYMDYQLAFYDDYSDRQEILDRLPDSLRQILYPTFPPDGYGIVPDKGRLKGNWKDNHPLLKVFEPGQANTYSAQPFNTSIGSNNWVIGSSCTKSKELFLCNDLHLYLTSPNVLYEMQLYCPALHVYGYTIPGAPLVLTGHNEKIAWGITSGGWDVTEEYVLKTDPGNPDNYWLDGKWKSMSKKQFTIEVKGGKAETVSVRYSVFGPVIQAGKLVYGLKWHPVQSCNAIESYWKLMQAGSWTEFRSALRDYDYPAQNFAYADVHGNIGMICAGAMPVKPSGYTGGLLDGTRSPICSYIAFDSLPQSFNPDRGYLFSANQIPQQATGSCFSWRWFDDLSRPKRIYEMLSEERKLDREDMRKMQLDIKDLSVNDLKVLLNSYYKNKRLSANWELMRNWDGILTPGRQQAIFYKCFRRSVRLATDEVSRSLAVRTGPRYDQFMHFLAGNYSLSYAGAQFDSRHYFDRIVVMADSLYATIKQRPDFNPYAFTIPQMTYLPGLDVDVKDIGGSDNTINVNHGVHPVVRTLIEINGDSIQSWMVNATGQTGRFNSRNYLQQFNAWKANDLHKTQFTTSPDQLKCISTTIFIGH